MGEVRFGSSVGMEQERTTTNKPLLTAGLTLNTHLCQPTPLQGDFKPHIGLCISCPSSQVLSLCCLEELEG